jgi:hypothetical protein
MWTCHAVSKGHDFISFLVSILDFNICNSAHSLTIGVRPSSLHYALCQGPRSCGQGTSIPSVPNDCVPASRQDSERIPDWNSLILDQFIFGRCFEYFPARESAICSSCRVSAVDPRKGRCQPCSQIIAPQRFPYVRICSKQWKPNVAFVIEAKVPGRLWHYHVST